MKCKFCNREEIVTLKKVQSPYVDYKYSLYRCESCNSCFFDEKEHEVDIKTVYEEYAQNFLKNANITFSPSSYWKNQVRVCKQLYLKSINSVLDIGCRTGDFLLHFDDTIIRDGVELSEKYVMVARKRGIKVYNDFVEKIKFEKKYDIVTCFAVLEHLATPFSFMDKFKHIVNDNGVLLIMIPTQECWKLKIIDKMTDIRWHMYSPPQHLNFFSRQFLDTYINKQGFKLVKRTWTSGGIFNPFRSIPVINNYFSGFMEKYDNSSLACLPIFDHMYSYFRKEK